MREILFRGKRLDNGEWVEGESILINNKYTLIAKVGRLSVEDGILNGIYNSVMYAVDPSTVGQYTGLTDRNGKRIFEGDILTIARKADGMGTYYFPAIEYPVKVVVKWDMCAWMWETIAKDKRYISFPDAWCHFDCEIIGNIHDNPELLKGE